MLNKRKKRILITTAIMLCIVAVIVSVAAIYVHIKNKNIVPTKVSYKEIMESTTLPIGKYENLDLSNAVLNIPKADKLYNYYKLGQTYEIYTPDEAAQLCRDMFMKLYDYTESDGLIFGDINCTPWTNEQSWNPDFRDCSFHISYPDRVYDNPSAGLGHGYACIDLEGTLRFDHLLDYGVYSDSELVESINISRGEQLPDKSYDLRGGEYKMTDAVEFGSKTLDSIKEYLPDADIQPARLNVFKTPLYVDNFEITEYYYEYQIEYEYVLDGIPVCDSSSAAFSAAESLFKVSNNKIYLVIDTPDKLSTLSCIGPFMYPNKEEQPLKDEFITLDKACEMLSNFLAPKFVQHIDEVTVKYANTWDNTVYYEETEKRVGRPCWCFITDQGYAAGNGCSYPCEKQIVVDMQTGDIFVNVGDKYESNLTPKNDKSVIQQQLDEWDGQANGS